VKKSHPLKKIARKVDNLLMLIDAKKVSNGKAAVFFDIDGTVSRDDSLELLITEIIRRKLLPYEKKEMYDKARMLWKSRETGFRDYIEIVIDIIPCLKDFSSNILNKVACDVVNENSYYYIFPWLLLIKLKCLGYKLIAVSGAPDFFTELYLPKIGIFTEEINATNWIVKNNVFTGDLDLSIIENKGKFIEKKYKDRFDLKKSIALGDTLSDVSMLKKVGKKIIINPTQELAIVAKKNKWPIVIERKDLILIFNKGQIDFEY
jgi:HAD superfamily phosphoserine phosphatase-like hydrolase